ncbi:MAG TPA: hypothetical protein VGK03_13625 [Geothrix sp.]|jgi:hypothetical protein
MIRTGIVLASLTLPVWGGTTPPRKPQTKAAPIHKSKVPVTVTAVFGEGKATVKLRFDQAVEEAVIGIRGLDGLQVANVPPQEKATFAKGEILTLEMYCTPGPGRSQLAVDIEGRFRGQRRMAVQTFAVGKPSAEQLKAAEGTVVTTPEGQRLKVMPVKQD